MKKNGFTFVELIVIIGLLALLAIIIGTNMVGLQGKQQDKNYEAFKKKLESAACLYIEKSNPESYKGTGTWNNFRSTCRSTSGCNVNLGWLIEEGLISEDLANPSIEDDKKTEEKENAVVNMKNKTVHVSYNNGTKKCEYNE